MTKISDFKTLDQLNLLEVKNAFVDWTKTNEIAKFINPENIEEALKYHEDIGLYEFCLYLEVISENTQLLQCKWAHMLDILNILENKKNQTHTKNASFFRHYQAKIHYNTTTLFDEYTDTYDYTEAQVQEVIKQVNDQRQFKDNETNHYDADQSIADIQATHNVKALELCMENIGCQEPCFKAITQRLTQQRKQIKHSHKFYFALDKHSISARLCSVIFNYYVSVTHPGFSKDPKHGTWPITDVTQFESDLNDFLLNTAKLEKPYNHTILESRKLLGKITQAGSISHEEPASTTHEPTSDDPTLNKRKRKKTSLFKSEETPATLKKSHFSASETHRTSGKRTAHSDSGPQTSNKRKFKDLTRPQPNIPTYQSMHDTVYNTASILGSTFLRGHQKKAITDLLTTHQSHPKAFLTMATGSGKTAILAKLVDQYVKHNSPLIILVPSVQLAEQTETKLKTYANQNNELAYVKDHLGVYCPSQPLNRREVNLVTIITYQSFTNLTFKSLNELRRSVEESIESKTMEASNAQNTLTRIIEANFPQKKANDLIENLVNILCKPLIDTFFSGKRTPIKKNGIPQSIHEQLQFIFDKNECKLLEAIIPLDQPILDNIQSFYQPENYFHLANTQIPIVADEGHHLESPKIINYLTATSKLEHPLVVTSLSASTLPDEYPKLQGLDFKLSHCLQLEEAINQEILSPLQLVTLDFSMFDKARRLSTHIIRKQIIEQRRELNQWDQNQINELMQSDYGINYTALYTFWKMVTRKSTKLSLVFARNIDHASLISMILKSIIDNDKESSRPVYIYHSQLPNKERHQVLSEYKASMHGILISVEALTEGYDVENINLALDFRTYKSKIRRMVQTLGRILRRDPDKPEDGATYMCIKLLYKSMQKIARNEIFNNKGIVGNLNPASRLTQANFPLTLPPTQQFLIKEQSETIHASSAKILLPTDTSLVNIGNPPEIEEDPQLNIMLQTHGQPYQGSPQPISGQASSSLHQPSNTGVTWISLPYQKDQPSQASSSQASSSQASSSQASSSQASSSQASSSQASSIHNLQPTLGRSSMWPERDKLDEALETLDEEDIEKMMEGFFDNSHL